MDPIIVLHQLEHIQRTEINSPEWNELQEAKLLPEFYQALINLLINEEGAVTSQQKLLVVSAMYQLQVKFINKNDLYLLVPLLLDNNLNKLVAKLIVSDFNDSVTFLDFIEPLVNRCQTCVILLVSSFIENSANNTNEIIFFQRASVLLHFYLQTTSIPNEFKIEATKCLVAISRPYGSDATGNVIHILFDIFVNYPICDENIPIFHQCLQLRFYFEKINKLVFYRKIQELALFAVQQKGPAKGTDDSSFYFYLSQEIFRMLEFECRNFTIYLIMPLDKLITLLVLFTVYHPAKLVSWSHNVEDFFVDNELDILSSNEDENFVFKEPNELRVYIFKEFIESKKYDFDPPLNLVGITLSVCQSLIGREIPNFPVNFINLSVISFFNALNENIPFDIVDFLETSDDIGKLYLIRYCVKNNIIIDNLTEKLTFFLMKDSHIYRFLVASALIHCSQYFVDPILFSQCFELCLPYLLEFDTEIVIDAINQLILLSDFHNKPEIAEGFAERMTTIIPQIINILMFLKNAYVSASHVCELISHFISFEPFKQGLLPHLMNIIGQLCSNPENIEIGLSLECSVFKIFRNNIIFNDSQISSLFHLFKNNLLTINFIENCDCYYLISPVLLVAKFFVSNSYIDVFEEWLFNALSIEDIPNHFFVKIAPVIVLLLKNDKSQFSLPIFKLMLERAGLQHGKFKNELFSFSVIAAISQLSLENPESLISLITNLGHQFNNVLTSVQRHPSSFCIFDDRLVISMLHQYKDHSVLTSSGNSMINLGLLFQIKIRNFFHMVIEQATDDANHLIDISESRVFDKGDDIYNIPLMQCPLSEYLIKLFPESSEEYAGEKEYLKNVLLNKNL